MWAYKILVAQILERIQFWEKPIKQFYSTKCCETQHKNGQSLLLFCHRKAKWMCVAICNRMFFQRFCAFIIVGPEWKVATQIWLATLYLPWPFKKCVSLVITTLQHRDGNRSGRPAPVGLPVGSRFFDRPVKPVEKPVKFLFLATKRHLSTNLNIHLFYHK